MIVYRLAKEPYHLSLTGIGAQKYGGRWNSIGFPVIYTAEHSALAILEVLAHLKSGISDAGYFLVEVEVPNMPFVQVDSKTLPNKWQAPFDYRATRKIGDAWLRSNKSLLLKVPSALSPMAFNLLINPNHSAFPKVHIKQSEAFSFDGRLL